MGYERVDCRLRPTSFYYTFCTLNLFHPKKKIESTPTSRYSRYPLAVFFTNDVVQARACCTLIPNPWRSTAGPLSVTDTTIRRYSGCLHHSRLFAPQFVHRLAFLSVSVVPPDEPGRTKNQLNLSLAMALESHAVEVEELGRLFPTIRTWDCFETLLWWCTIGTIPLIPRWQIRVIR